MVLTRQRGTLNNRIHATLAKYGITIDGAGDAFGKRGLQEGKTRPSENEIEEYAGEIDPGDPSSIAGHPDIPQLANEASSKRLIGALLAEKHETWSTGKKNFDMAEYLETRVHGEDKKNKEQIQGVS